MSEILGEKSTFVSITKQVAYFKSRLERNDSKLLNLTMDAYEKLLMSVEVLKINLSKSKLVDQIDSYIELN